MTWHISSSSACLSLLRFFRTPSSPLCRAHLSFLLLFLIVWGGSPRFPFSPPPAQCSPLRLPFLAFAMWLLPSGSAAFILFSPSLSWAALLAVTLLLSHVCTSPCAPHPLFLLRLRPALVSRRVSRRLRRLLMLLLSIITSGSHVLLCLSLFPCASFLHRHPHVPRLRPGLRALPFRGGLPSAASPLLSRSSVTSEPNSSVSRPFSFPVFSFCLQARRSTPSGVVFFVFVQPPLGAVTPLFIHHHAMFLHAGLSVFSCSLSMLRRLSSLAIFYSSLPIFAAFCSPSRSHTVAVAARVLGAPSRAAWSLQSPSTRPPPSSLVFVTLPFSRLRDGFALLLPLLSLFLAFSVFPFFRSPTLVSPVAFRPLCALPANFRFSLSAPGPGFRLLPGPCLQQLYRSWVRSFRPLFMAYCTSSLFGFCPVSHQQ